VPIFSRRFSLWTRLYGRMLLEPTSDANVTPLVSEIVVPVLDADRLLSTPYVRIAGGDLSPSAGSIVTFFTCPDGEEWELITVVLPSTSGSTRLWINVINAEGGRSEVNLTASASGESWLSLQGYTFQAGDSMGVLTTGNAGDSDENMKLFYTSIDLTT